MCNKQTGILLLFLLMTSVGLTFGQPPIKESVNESEIISEETRVIDYQAEVIGTWLETWTVIGTDSSSVINLEGKENYWEFKKDGSFTSSARWAFTKDPLMKFGEYTYSFEKNQLFWDGEPSGWEIVELSPEYLITPARFIGDKQGVTIWKRVSEIEYK